MLNIFLRRVSSAKAIALIAVLAVFTAGYTLASVLGFNVMSGDQELVRMRDATQGVATWGDPISANAGDQIRLMVYYHCGTDDPAWTTVRAYNTVVRLEFPTAQQTTIVTTGRVSANNLSTVSDPGTINVSSSQKLNFGTDAIWYHDGTSQNVTTTLGNGYIQVNLGDLECDYLNCYTKAGFVVFSAAVSSIFPAPTVDLLANSQQGPITIPYNTAATLSWTSTNATSCAASGDWSGARATSGSESTGPLTSSKTYYIVCAGPGGNSPQDSVGVTIQVLQPTVDLLANGQQGPITINYNTAATLSWTTTNNPTTCTASNGWSGSKSIPSGSESTGLLTVHRTYVLTCSNSAGSAQDSVLVQVLHCLPAPPPMP